MNLILNAIVLILEVLYYSLFMKFARKEGKFWRYLLAFTINTILILIFNSANMISYLFFIVFSVTLLKYIVKSKVSLYDMFLVVIMIFIKFIIEFTTYVIIFKLLNINHFVTTIIFDVLKILFVICLKRKLSQINIYLKNLWDNNNFYIRYIFSVAIFLYVIVTIILKLIVPFVK